MFIKKSCLKAILILTVTTLVQAASSSDTSSALTTFGSSIHQRAFTLESGMQIIREHPFIASTAAIGLTTGVVCGAHYAITRYKKIPTTTHSPSYVMQHVDYYAQDRHGNTMLHLALTNNETDTFSRLPDDIEPNIQNEAGQTLLHIAIQKRFSDIVHQLITRHNANPLIKDNQGNSALFLVSHDQDSSIINSLIIHPLVTGNEQDKDGNTLFHKALIGENIPVIEMLIRLNKVNPLVQNNKSETIAHIAYKKNIRGLPSKYIEPAINAQDQDGNTLLHLACQQHDRIMVENILSLHPHADILLRNTLNRTALGMLRYQHERIYTLVSSYTPENTAVLPRFFSPNDAAIAAALITKMKERYHKNSALIQTITDRFSQQSSCPICMDPLKKATTTVCCFGINCCEECIVELMRQPHPKCPQCREILFKEMVIGTPSTIHFVKNIFTQVYCQGLSIKDGKPILEEDRELLAQLMAAVRARANQARA